MTAAASPTKNDLLITPTDVSNGIPADGIDFFLGPDLQASVKKTLDGVCAGEDLSSECIRELSVALDQANQYAIESRVVGGGLLLAAAGAAIVGLGMKLFDAPQPELAHFHLESTDIRAIQSMTEDTAVLATSAGTENHITVTIAPTPTVAEKATITTLSADASGHHKGDVLIALPSHPARLLEQLLRRAGAPDSCGPDARGIKKRQRSGPQLMANYNNINNVATFVLPNAAPGQLLHGLALQALGHLPELKGECPSNMSGIHKLTEHSNAGSSFPPDRTASRRQSRSVQRGCY